MLKPTVKSWVPHIMVFVAPRLVLTLGAPAKRSADACESFGARLKKLIKHLTCRRRCRVDAVGVPEEHIHSSTRDGVKKKWTQALQVGYIQQAFSRACVSVANLYTAESRLFLQREDARQISIGRAGKRRDEQPAPARNVRVQMERDIAREMM